MRHLIAITLFVLTAQVCSAGNFHQTSQKVLGDSTTGEVIISGNNTKEGSKRIGIDDDSGMIAPQELTSGIWQTAPLETSADTLWLGHGIGLSSIGHHVSTKSVDGHMHFHAHNAFNPDTGLSETDAMIMYAFAHDPAVVYNGDDTGTWTGTSFAFTMTSPAKIMVKSLIYKTDTTAASDVVEIRIYEGSDDQGTLLIHQKFPASDWPASSTVTLPFDGYIEFAKDQNYHVTYNSDADFSFKTDVTVTYPYFTGDTVYYREDNMLQTKPWEDGATWGIGDLFIDDRKLYRCNVSGVQTGTFAANSAKWDILTVDTIVAPDGDKASITDTRFFYDDGTRYRLDITDTYTQFYDQSGGYLALYSGALQHEDHLGQSRMEIDTARNRWYSPNGTHEFTLDNAGFALTDGSLKRVYLDSSTYYKTVSAAGEATGFFTALSNLGFTVWKGTQPRLNVGISETNLIAEENGWQLTADNSGVYAGNGTNRLEITPAHFKIKSPDFSKSISVSNGLIDNQTYHFNIGDFTRTRLNTTTDETNLWSPNGANRIRVDNTNTSIFGSVTVAEGFGSYQLRIAPYSEHHSGGSLVFEGADRDNADPGPLTYFENYNLDNFWGYLRMYTSGASLKRIEMSNVTPYHVTTAPNANFRLDVKGDILMPGHRGFNDTGETAKFTVGGTGYHIKNTYGGDFEIDGLFGLKIKRNGVTQLDVGLTQTTMNSPDGDSGIEIDDQRSSFVGIDPVRLPRLTTAERNGITAGAGDTIFNTVTTKMEVYDGSTWQPAW